MAGVGARRGAGRAAAGRGIGSAIAGLRGGLTRAGKLWAVCLLLGLVSATGCVGAGLLTDGSSVACGSFHGGYLRRGKRLPDKGAGYVIPELWRARGNNFATDEMVSAIQRVARRVAKEHPGSVLGVADLSQPGGGESKLKLHRSHQNGHDADLIWYALDDEGKPAEPTDCMPIYGSDLRARPPHPTPGVTFSDFTPRRFDVRRNWALVRALLEDPDIEVQYLFIHNRLRSLLLEHARNRHESEELIDRAEALLKQPGDSLPHDDHLHLRIFCSPTDRALGCRDIGPQRWWKKRYKYMPPRPPHPPVRLAALPQRARKGRGAAPASALLASVPPAPPLALPGPEPLPGPAPALETAVTVSAAATALAPAPAAVDALLQSEPAGAAMSE